MTTPKKKPDQANWKITPAILKRVKLECVNRGLKQAQLAEIALDALSGIPPGSADSIGDRSEEFQRKSLPNPELTALVEWYLHAHGDWDYTIRQMVRLRIADLLKNQSA